MKLSYTILIVILSLLFSCGQGNKTENKIPEQQVKNSPDVKVDLTSLKKNARKMGPLKSVEEEYIEYAIEAVNWENIHKTIGFWVGDFGNNQINIAILFLEGDNTAGHIVTDGNYIPFSGTVETVSDSVYTINFFIKDRDYKLCDGDFQFTVNTSSNILKGKWEPYEASRSSRSYKLKKRKYEFSKTIGNYPVASQRLLTEEDVNNLFPETLMEMRNEIYARYGYSFQTDYGKSYSARQSWYMPVRIDVREKLTDIEVQNIDLMYRYEKYNESFYDDYGR
jgi:hypothetical protein